LLEFNTDAVQQPALAEELVPNSDATEWTIHLRQGVTWHNGRTFTADDVIYTFRRMVNPSNPLAGASAVTLLDVPNMRKLDDHTVSAPCHASFATFPQVLSGEHFFIVPVGYNPKQPIGTGPFKFKSFTPGVRSVFVRNENYWKEGLPYADEINTIDFADQTSQLNALASNQVDVIDLLTAESISVLKSNGNQPVVSEGGGFIPFTMRIDQPPFNDVRVRQAMRLIVNRPQLRELVYGGYGVLGNDVQSIWDPSYDHALPQREQDLAQAKFLLKQAGRSDLVFTLTTSAIATGSVQAAQVLAQQAKDAGVTINLQTITETELYGPNYLRWGFAQDFYVYNPYFLQVSESMLPTAPYNETHFNDPRYTTLYNEGLATVDDTKRTDIVHEMQEIEYTIGGYIIPCFPPYIDGISAKVHGVTPGKVNPLSGFGFERFWIE
jgi:peptide/nickel transport system substrate-binding protein